jgi:hypothetical protein
LPRRRTQPVAKERSHVVGLAELVGPLVPPPPAPPRLAGADFLPSPVEAEQIVQTFALGPDPFGPRGSQELVAGGVAAADTITVNENRLGQLQVAVRQLGSKGGFAATEAVPASSVDRIVLYGGGGRNIISIGPRVTLPALIFGGAGPNVLTAGGGPSVLVGGPGGTKVRDTLVAGSAPSILIAGGGPATLVANGPGDILIGGQTDFDANALALSALLAEWSNPRDDYPTRIAHLLGPVGGGSGGGLNQGFFLNPTTVHDDHARDLLVGGRFGLDWFFASAAGRDLLFNRRRGETVTDIL